MAPVNGVQDEVLAKASVMKLTDQAVCIEDADALDEDESVTVAAELVASLPPPQPISLWTPSAPKALRRDNGTPPTLWQCPGNMRIFPAVDAAGSVSGEFQPMCRMGPSGARGEFKPDLVLMSATRQESS